MPIDLTNLTNELEATCEDLARKREARLALRARIREANPKRPRCSGCGADMPISTELDLITQEQLDEDGGDYLVRCDFRAGDLVCFWCVHAMTDVGDLFQWGRA